MASRAEISAACLALYRRAAMGRNMSELELVALAMALASRLDAQVDLARLAAAFRQFPDIPQPQAVAEAAMQKRRLPRHEPDPGPAEHKTPGLGRALYQKWKNRKDFAQ